MFRRGRSTLEVVGRHRITLDGQSIEYLVKRSSRAKHVRLEVGPESGLTVVIPRSYDARRVPETVKAKRDWVLRKLAKHGETRALASGGQARDGDTVPYLGKNLKLKIGLDRGQADTVRLVRGMLLVTLGSRAASRADLVLERWYRLQAARLLKEKADRLGDRMGVACGRITIRGQKTRWGSCSRKGTLSLNWKLMMAPEPVIDYVVVHELAHLREMNHTGKFWEIVAQHCPRWRQHRKWLKEHEAGITATLPF